MPAEPNRSQETRRASVSIVASNFPPVRGGSSAVYGNLARCAGGAIGAIAPSRGYVDLLPTIGWREHDMTCGYPVPRVPLVRTPKWRPGGPELVSAARFRATDARIRAQVMRATLAAAGTSRHTVCVGELVAGGWLLHALRRVPRIRTIAYVHGEEITIEDPHDLDRAHTRARLRAADGIVAVSRFTAGEVERLLGPGHGKPVALVENGVDTARFTPAPRRADLVRRYGLDGAFTFVSVCRLVGRKGIDHAMLAFDRVADDLPGCRMLVAGGGEMEGSLRQVAASCRHGDRIVMAGEVPDEDLADHYRLGDAFLMPNRAMPNGDTEGFGLVFLEANACGLPVIAGQDGGSVDAVTDGDNGLVVDGSSVEAVAAAMRRLATDDGTRDRIARNGLATARAADWSRKAGQFLDFAETLHGARARPARTTEHDA